MIQNNTLYHYVRSPDGFMQELILVQLHGDITPRNGPDIDFTNMKLLSSYYENNAGVLATGIYIGNAAKHFLFDGRIVLTLNK